ncbi:MAG TPA: ABC transporter ATP-binding protein [Gammaproteobacteria bacterium]|nr:ABC transporter ATP-binding protein [Gammaproteobacteria bacterium]
MTEPAHLVTLELAVRIGGVQVCRALDLDLAPGTCWALMGQNGSGKTTLLHTLAGLRPATAGEIHLDGRALPQWRRPDLARRLGLLTQDFQDPFPATVLDTALLGRHPWLSLWQWEGPADLARARAALKTVGLAEFEQRNIATLSGGERRRLGIATLLTQDPAVLLLDEPANHLDLRHRQQILATLAQLAHAQQRTVMMSLHDPALAWRFCDHALLLMGDGEVVAGETREVLNADNLTRLYDYPVACAQVGDERVFVVRQDAAHT